MVESYLKPIDGTPGFLPKVFVAEMNRKEMELSFNQSCTINWK